MHDVIIVGAGPAGLMLSIILAENGLKCKIIEKREKRSVSSRAFGLLAHTLELLDIYDLANPLIALGTKLYQIPLGIKNFYLNTSQLKSETKYPFILSIPQTEIENFLEQHALKSGVSIEKAATATNLIQYENYIKLSVTCNNREKYEQASYLIGADGKNSRIRELSKIAYVGFTYNKTFMHGDVELSDNIQQLTFSKLSPNGMLAYFKLPLEKYYRVLVLDHRMMHIPHTKKLELVEFIQSANSLAQFELGIKNPLWLSRFRIQQCNAEKYSIGHVFLIGDAAHAHPPAGGQGLQSAIQDAFNLGWKLINKLQNKAGATLLATYELERRPMIKNSLKKSAYLLKYEISKSYLVFILRKFFVKMMSFRCLQKNVLLNLSCMNAKHKIWSNMQHPIVGEHAYRYQFSDFKEGFLSINFYLKKGMFILVLPQNESKILESIVSVYRRSIEVIIGKITHPTNPQIILIRPDGIIAWASNGALSINKFTNTLLYWLGANNV